MKKTITYILYILVLCAVVACDNGDREIVEPMYDKVVFNAVADSPSTRTALIFGGGKYQATWKAGDTFRIVQIANGEKSVYSGTVAEDCLRLSSIAEFETKIADEYVYLFGYPTLSMNSLCTYVAFTLPAEQNPTTIDTFDGNADMLLSECVVRKSQPIGESIRFNIKRLSSIGKFTVKNLALAEGDKVKSVTFSCTKPISGEITNLQLSDLMAGDISIENSTFVEDQNYNYVKVSLAEPQSEEFTYYMSCWPTTLAAGEQYTIVIETEQDEYVKTATLPFDLVFEQNEITTLTVNMAGVVAKNAAPATYKILYTSTDGKVVTPNKTDVFGAKIMSNTYENGQGEIVFDSDVTKIGDGAFCESRKLASVIIPDSVTEIGTEAFKFCTALTDITIGNGVTTIGQNAFRGCTYIESITIPDSVTTIGVSAFYNCNKLANVTIGNSVTTIGEAAFYNCNNLETISIPSSVVTIGASAFCSTALVGVTIPEGVTTIGSGAFSYCAALASVTMSSSVTTIGDSAFNECSSLAAVYISDLSAWCKLSFNVETSIATNPLYNGATLYLNGTAIAELTIPADITEVKSYAFIGCGSLVKVTIPDSVTTIGELAFRNCDALTEAIVGDGVITIEDSVFRNCSGLTSVTIGNSVTTMGDTVFYGCSGLTSVTISENVTKLGKQVFYDCTSLASVYCKPLTPPSLYTEVFENNATDRKFYVPAESLDAYKTASGWRLYADAIEVDPESVVEVDLSQYTDLSAEGTANCYLVKSSGNYKLKAVKGNSDTSVGDAQSASVLWETFGTATTPNIGDLVTSAGYQDGYVYFSTPSNFANGNASIAVHDSNNTILWSWHIWCSAEGWEDDVYANNAGTMMDRNLGATSATPGSVGALGLLYQWGRKDPFLGASSISADALAVSTGNWTTNSSQQTVEGTCQNPTIFIYTSDAQDWCIGDGYGDSNYDLRWKDTEKTAYDPCPIGYRVPKGGFWATANTTTLWDSTNYGLSWTIADGTTAWYPAVGYLNYDGSLRYVGSNSCCWSASPRPGYTDQAYSLVFWAVDSVYPTNHPQRMLGVSVRCVREGSDSGSSTPDPGPTPDPEVDLSQYTDLSAEGTANCYLVKSAGNYKLKAVKGNSTVSVGDAQSASVLWETFGTDVMPNVGDLVRNVGYKDGYVYFSTPSTFANGNASIAVHDANNTILWSWHIWCSAEGWEDDIYANNAGTMMDRNLGATSATPGSVGALGLMYQWGRKDPFLGASSISVNNLAVSTGDWTTNSSQQTVEYACQNPTIFICVDDGDWGTDDGSEYGNYSLRWKDAEKTMYDPCPVGYKVAKGGEDGFWPISIYLAVWDKVKKGYNLTLADGTTAWYPAASSRNHRNGMLEESVGYIGCYWSSTLYPTYNGAYCFSYCYDSIFVANFGTRGGAFSVRCFREGSDSGSSTPDPEIPATPGNRTIMTVADLQNFIAAVNAGDYSAWKSSDGEVKLGADLDLAGADLTPIESFDGVFNGQNFALKNWKTTRGLFDKNTGVVKNVVIDATCALTVAYDSTGDKQSGFVAENNQPTGVVSGCVNHGFVKSTDVSCAGHRIGGVVGVSYGIVNDCINYGEVNITSEAVNSSLYIGGVVGFINTNASTKDALGADFLVNCINRGKVIVLFPSLPNKVFVGGVLGGTKTDASTTATYLGQIKNCVNHGEVSYRFETLDVGTYGNVGGVVGYAQANIENCDNYGKVSYTTPTDPSAAGRRAAAGGVVGCNIFGITNCNNYGELFVEGVWASGTSDAAAAGSQAGSSFGGVVGCVGVYNTYKADYPTVGCNNYGKVDLNVACKTGGGTAGYFAGVLGYSTNDVEDCHNYGEVNIWTYLSTTYLAGVVGYTTASVDNLTNNNVVNLEVEGVTTTGKTLYPAGVVGRAKAIANCVNNGETNVVVNPCEIAISTIYGGGVAGYVETKIENSTLNAPFSLTTADNQASLRCAGVVGQAKTGTAPIYTAINCNTTEKATVTLNTKNTKANYIGGIMGYCSNGLDNCTNKASIDVTFAEPNTGTSIVYVAGVSGNQKETMNNCHNEGNISVDMGESTCPLYAATLVGMNHTSACVVKDCTNSGNLEIVNYAGESQVVGIFGGNNPKTETDGVVTEEVTFENCTNTGIVTVNGTRVE